MHHPTDTIIHTTAFVTTVVEHWLEREIAQWVHPMKDRSDEPSHHERTLLPRSYISLHSCSKIAAKRNSHTFVEDFKETITVEMKYNRLEMQMDFFVIEGRKEMFYLTTHSTHLIYGYMVLANMVEDHSDS